MNMLQAELKNKYFFQFNSIRNSGFVTILYNKKMTIVQISLAEEQTETPKQQYKRNVISGLSKTQKELDLKYVYNKEGWQIWSEVLQTNEYYIMKAEEQILSRQSSDILSLMDSENFALVDIGAGNGLKTMIFIEESLKNNKKMEYIAIDISQKSNIMLKQNLLKFDDKIQSTIFTSLFDEGINWVSKNKKMPLFYFLIGITIGNFTPDQRKMFLKNVYCNMKSGDLFLITFDKKKDPSLIQKAYFNNNHLFHDILLINASRLNEISSSVVQKQNFWPHVFYNPMNGVIQGSLISAVDQKINIDAYQFLLKQNQTISIMRSERFSLRDFTNIMQDVGFSFVRSFEDSKQYGMATVFRKN